MSLVWVCLLINENNENTECPKRAFCVFQFNSLYAAGKDQEDYAVQSFLYNKKSNDHIRCVNDLILSIRYRIF